MLPTYVINLKCRTERKLNIEKEFSFRKEFGTIIIEAVKHKIGAVGLWETITNITLTASEKKMEYILICEDDHQFTEYYDFSLLQQCIKEAIQKQADILCGGPSWFKDAFPVSENLLWVKMFSGLQFTVVFKRFYAKILNADFNEQDAADYKISMLASNKYFIHPFHSTQKEFGYSDVTRRNNGTNRVEELFKTTEKNADILRNISSFYKNIQKSSVETELDFETITIPTYIINLPKRTERRTHIVNQFKGKKEFDATIVDACKHEIGPVGLWLSVRKVIQMALDNDDDVIIISEDDHEFTPEYSKEYLIQNIIEANEQGCEYLNCGTGKFGFAVPVSPNRFWTNHCLSTQFIVLYRKFFKKILDAAFDDTVAADMKFSQITEHKMILYPFVSLQHDFGYSDVTPIHNTQKDLVQNMFARSRARLDTIAKAVCEHQLFDAPASISGVGGISNRDQHS